VEKNGLSAGQGDYNREGLRGQLVRGESRKRKKISRLLQEQGILRGGGEKITSSAGYVREGGTLRGEECVRKEGKKGQTLTVLETNTGGRQGMGDISSGGSDVNVVGKRPSNVKEGVSHRRKRL